MSLFALGLSLLIAQVPSSSAEMLPYGGMDGPFADGLSRGWVANCYGTNQFAFSAERRGQHTGAAAQRITCTRFESGGVQLHSSGLAVVKGTPYTLRLWVKGHVSGPLWVGIRKHGAPYAAYLKRDVRVTNEWRPCVVAAEASDTDPDCGVYIMSQGTGTLLIDEVSLVPGLHTEIAEDTSTSPAKGNRVYNSGFEAGPSGWVAEGGPVLSPAAAHSGRTGAILAYRAIEARPFPVRAGMRYTISAYLRARSPGAHATLRMMEWADAGEDQPANRSEVSRTFPLTTQWDRYEASGVIAPNLWDACVVRVETDGAVCLDDVQVEEGAATAYVPMHDVELGAQTETRWTLPGSPVTVRAFLSGPGSGKPRAIRYELQDAWSRPISQWRHVAAGSSDSLTLPAPRQGCYRLKVTAERTASAAEVWFGVFPDIRTRSRFLGTHVAAKAGEPSLAMREVEGMGAGWIRLHDFGDFCHWYQVEPEKGRFVWHDAEVDALVCDGFSILANLGHPPVWAGRKDPRASANGGWTSAPPRDLAEWEDYVYRTVEHYRGRIRHWEIWNEPFWSGFFSGTPEEYTELLKTAYRAIKRADPSAVVIGGCFTPPAEEWTRGVLAAGALKWMDVLSYHAYWTPSATEAAGPKDTPKIEAEARRYIELMRAEGAVKPLWMSEGGVASPPFASFLPREGILGPSFAERTGAQGGSISTMEGASALVKAFTEMRAAEVEVACYYYAGGPTGAPPWYSRISNGAYVLMDFDGRPKPAMMAYAALAPMLEGGGRATLVRSRSLRGYAFARKRGSLAVVWSPHGGRLGALSAAVLDMMGNPAHGSNLRPGEPVYVASESLSSDTLARKLSASAAAAH